MQSRPFELVAWRHDETIRVKSFCPNYAKPGAGLPLPLIKLPVHSNSSSTSWGTVMAFVAGAEHIARTSMAGVRSDLAEKFALLVRFLALQPAMACPLRGARSPAVGTAEYIHIQATKFASSRNPKAPKAPSTVPDELVSIILSDYFGIPASDLERVKGEHLLSMGAENLVGLMLEHYLASVLEPRGWIWCSGEMVRAVDFVRPPVMPYTNWRMLQVKNRSNSENSSSSAIRVGTEIEKWFRTFSTRAGSNWAAFPDPEIRQHLSEEGFKTFVRIYLNTLRAMRP